MNNNMLNKAIEDYAERLKKYPAEYKEEETERGERISFYQSFTKSKIENMTIEDIYEYIGKLYSMVIWGNKKYIVDKIIANNGMANFKRHLINLLYGDALVVDRWNAYIHAVKGIGAATVSELLAYTNPDEYMIFNDSTAKCFSMLGLPNMPTYNYQFTGERFTAACDAGKEIAVAMKAKGIKDTTLLAVDYFLWDVILPQIKPQEKKGDKSVGHNGVQDTNEISITTISLHDEVKQKLIEIGRLLGFECDSEIKVSAGAKVDAIWEAKIGNMGKAIYVFEVQSKGGIDSLILNLIKVLKNPAVQAVVAVSDSVQLEKIRKECIGTSLENNIRLWDFEEVIQVHENLVKAHESINKLELVPDSFI